ncbi:MAG: hypothetical protein ACF8NJ_04265, partial [Phycisphaerales bacterium JB038]
MTVADHLTPSDPLVAFRLRSCVRCGYDLAGLPADHACPECGEPYSAQVLELVGWSQLGFIVGTLSWYLHLWVYALVGLVALTFAWGIGAALGGFWASLLPLGFCTLVALLVLARVRSTRRGSNLRLLVTDELVILDTGYTSLLRLAMGEPDEMFALGAELREAQIRLRHPDTWELRLSSGSIRSFRAASLVRIILHCPEDQALALAEELRERIRRALTRLEQEEPAAL